MKQPGVVGRRVMLFGCILLFVLSAFFAVDIVASRGQGQLSMPTIFYTASVAAAVAVQFVGLRISRMSPTETAQSDSEASDNTP